MTIIMVLKYRVDVRWGIALSHGQVGVFDLGWQTSYRWCFDKNTGGCDTSSPQTLRVKISLNNSYTTA